MGADWGDRSVSGESQRRHVHPRTAFVEQRRSERWGSGNRVEVSEAVDAPAERNPLCHGPGDSMIATMPPKPPPTPPPVRVRLETDKTTYNRGDPVGLKIVIINPAPVPVTIS